MILKPQRVVAQDASKIILEPVLDCGGTQVGFNQRSKLLFEEPLLA
jgi:hypothetical protein